MRTLRTKNFDPKWSFFLLYGAHAWPWEVAGTFSCGRRCPCGRRYPQRREGGGGGGREEGGRKVGRGKGGTKGIEVKKCSSLSY